MEAIALASLHDFVITIAIVVAIKNAVTVAFVVDFDFDFAFADAVPIAVNFAVAVAVAVAIAVNFIIDINFVALAWLPIRMRSYAFPGMSKVDSTKKMQQLTVLCALTAAATKKQSAVVSAHTIT